MSIADKLTTIAENMPKVYDAGKKAENYAFWKMIVHDERGSLGSAFSGWGAEYIRPPFKVYGRGLGDGNSTFNGCINLKKVEKEYFDFSTKPAGTSSQQSWYYTFYNCINLEEIEDIGLTPEPYMTSIFANCKKLHTIAKIRVNEETTYTESFTQCYALENITVEGVIGNNFYISAATKLSRASIEGIVNALSATATGKTVAFSNAAKKAVFTDSEWSVLIATKPNWTFGLW